MRRKEPKRNCPVCIGSVMLKVTPAKEVDVVLDYCQRCGGMWFDDGEADELRRCRPKSLSATIVLSDEAHRSPCHSCEAIIDRNDDHCPACGWKNEIACPVDDTRLWPLKRDQLKLDVCSKCHGVWFDNTELAQIWNRAVERHGATTHGQQEVRDHFFLGSVLDFFIYPIDAPTRGIGGAFQATGDLASRLPGAAGSLVEGAGELAGSIIEAVPGAAGSVVQAVPGIAGSVVETTGDVAGSVFGGMGDALDGIDFSGLDLGGIDFGGF